MIERKTLKTSHFPGRAKLKHEAEKELVAALRQRGKIQMSPENGSDRESRAKRIAVVNQRIAILITTIHQNYKWQIPCWARLCAEKSKEFHEMCK